MAKSTHFKRLGEGFIALVGLSLAGLIGLLMLVVAVHHPELVGVAGVLIVLSYTLGFIWEGVAGQ